MTGANAEALWALFGASFLAATLLPGGSEAVLAALALDGQHGPPTLLAVATAGNTLGGLSSWALGRVLAGRRGASLTGGRGRALRWLQRWGSPALLLAWVPVVGDPLCLAAGWLRIPWYRAAVPIAAGKAARYALVLGALPGP